MWNINTRTRDELPITNNSVASCFPDKHWRLLPSFMEVMLKREQFLRQVHIAQISGGHEPPSRGVFTRTATNQVHIAQISGGHEPPSRGVFTRTATNQVHIAQISGCHEPQRRVYEDRNQRILNLVQALANITTLAYLRYVDYNNLL